MLQGSGIYYLIILSLLSYSISSYEEESCYSYAGGNIYPHGSGNSIDHKLQFTKAVSTYTRVFLINSVKVKCLLKWCYENYGNC